MSSSLFAAVAIQQMNSRRSNQGLSEPYYQIQESMYASDTVKTVVVLGRISMAMGVLSGLVVVIAAYFS